MTLYFLSGLGADRRVFGRLELPPRYRVVYLDWLPPRPGESLPQYALRMAGGIDRQEPFALLGLSFGGMLATEVAKTGAPTHTLLLSSAATRAELPPLYRFLGALQLDHLAPAALFRQQNALLDWYFGASDPDTKALLHAIIRDSDARFNRWAVQAILDWRNRTLPAGLHRLHGSADRVLPARRIPGGERLEGAGHLAVYTHAPQVSEWIARTLAS